MPKMKAAVFVEPGPIVLDEKPIPAVGPLGEKHRAAESARWKYNGRADLKPLVTHRFKLEDIERAYELFSSQRDGVLKVAITP